MTSHVRHSERLSVISDCLVSDVAVFKIAYSVWIDVKLILLLKSLQFVSICHCSDSTRIAKTEEAETQVRQKTTAKDEHPAFFVDRNKAVSPPETVQKQCEETEPIDVDSSDDSGDEEPMTLDESDGASSDASNSDNSDVMPSNVNDTAASISETSDDEVTFKISAPKRNATKSTPLRNARPESAVKMVTRRRSVKSQRTPDVHKVAVSSIGDSTLPLTDKENRLASRANCSPANVLPKSGAKSSPRKASKMVCICSLPRISVNLNQGFSS